MAAITAMMAGLILPVRQALLILLGFRAPCTQASIGTSVATRDSMLRIKLPATSGPAAFVLEGKLSGLWAKELIRVARQTKDGCSSIFDLREVFYTDAAGEQALRFLSHSGARFVAESAYGKGLCKRLKL